MPRNIEIIQRQFGSDNPLPSIELADNTLKLGGVEAQDYALKEEVNEVADDLSEHESDDVRHLVQSQIDKIDASINSTQAQTIAQSAVTAAEPTILSNAYIAATHYADTHDTETLTSAKNYADGKDATNLQTAKDYADGKDTTTLNSAKSYTDTQIAGIDMSGKEDKSNKVTSMSSSSTDTQYPSAKAVYDAISAAGGDIEELTSPVTIWNLEDGLYKLPESCEVNYKSGLLYASSTAYMAITSKTTNGVVTDKYFFIFDGFYSYRRAITGKVTSSSGEYTIFDLNGSYLTNISSYVKNQLDYSTSDTTYALSAYQGYALDQGKENISNKVTSMSSSSTDTQYPSAKAVYDAVEAAKDITELTSPVRIAELTDGIYKLPRSSTIYYSGKTDTTKTITTLATSFLFVINNSTASIQWVLMKNGDTAGDNSVIYGKTTGNKNNGGSYYPLEMSTNKVTSITSSSTDNQYPSAKLLYDSLSTKVNGNTYITDIWKGTQAEYDAMASHDSTTLYLIEET
jgi:3-methyladenine DNA glycosylase AlkC